MRHHDSDHGIETYPVGILADLQHRKVRSAIRRFKRHVETRDWRALRNSMNGYLAEWNYPPESMNHRRAGHGWTRRRALRDLGRHIVEVNLSEREATR